jgi:hypothetical protein
MSGQELNIGEDMTPLWTNYISALQSNRSLGRSYLVSEPKWRIETKDWIPIFCPGKSCRSPNLVGIKLWKLKCLAKAKLFMWLLVHNKAPTWDHLQRRNFIRPGRCSLCKCNEETNQHLIMDCPYMGYVWEEISRHVRLRIRWATV